MSEKSLKKEVDKLLIKIDKISKLGQDGYIGYCKLIDDTISGVGYEVLDRSLIKRYKIDINKYKTIEDIKKKTFPIIRFHTNSSLQEDIKRLYDINSVYQIGQNIYSVTNNTWIGKFSELTQNTNTYYLSDTSNGYKFTSLEVTRMDVTYESPLNPVLLLNDNNMKLINKYENGMKYILGSAYLDPKYFPLTYRYNITFTKGVTKTLTVFHYLVDYPVNVLTTDSAGILVVLNSLGLNGVFAIYENISTLEKTISFYTNLASVVITLEFVETYPTYSDTNVLSLMTAVGTPNDGTIYYTGTFHEITGAQIWYNVNEVITGLKTDGVWPHLQLLSLHIGNTTTSQKFNAINPIDTDGAHRLTYEGTGGYVDHNGAHFIDSNYINTHWSPNGITSGFFFGVSQRNNKKGIGFGTVLGSGSLCWVDFHGRIVYGGWVIPETFTTNKSQAILVFDRPDVTQFNLYIDGVPHNKVEDLWGSPLGINDFYVGCQNDANPTPTPVSFSEANIDTIFAGTTMDATKHLALKNRLYTFNNAMKRTQRNAYIFGDSVTDGSNSDTPYPLNRWSYHLCQSLGLNEINYGEGGRVLIESTPAPYPPSMYDNSTKLIPTKTADDKYVFIAYGINDARFLVDLGYTNYTTALFTTQLQTIIDNILAKGWSASDIVFITGYRTNSTCTTQYGNLVTATHNVGSANGCQVIDVSGLSYVAGDGIHPPQTGHIEIAAYIETVLV